MADNNLPANTEKKQLPSLAELHHDVEQAFKNDQLKLLLNQSPNQKWLKPHPFATKKITDKEGVKREVPAEYLPIDKTEFLLDRIFQEWKTEILREGQIFHSVYVVVRVHYLNPVTGIWSFHDGVGALKLQSDKGKPFSSDSIKDNAVQIAFPACVSYAIKDATDHLGKLFGRDANRSDTLDWAGSYSKQDPPPPESAEKEEERLTKLINKATSRSELNNLKKHLVTQEHRDFYDTRWRELK